MERAEIAERMPKWLGAQKVSETTENVSYGARRMRDGVLLNDQRKEKRTIRPDRLIKLPNLEAYLKVPGDYPIAKMSLRFISWRVWRRVLLKKFFEHPNKVSIRGYFFNLGVVNKVEFTIKCGNKNTLASYRAISLVDKC